MPPGDARHSEAVEIKWGVHPAGERRAGWVTDDPRSILSLLISGRFRIDLPDRSVVLAEQGDYVVFRGVNHTWQAEEESIVVSVRWPSLPGYDQVGQGQRPAPLPSRNALDGADDGRSSSWRG